MPLPLLLALIACTADDPKATVGDDTDPVRVDDTDAPPADDTDAVTGDVDAQAALDALRDASLTPVRVTPGPGAPRAVAAVIPLGGGDPVDEALALLDAFAPLFGLTDPRRQLHPVDARDGDAVRPLRFRQVTATSQGDLPVFNAGVTVHTDGANAWMITSRWLPDLAPAPPALTWEAALRRASFTPDVIEVTPRGEPRLGVWVSWDEQTGVGTPFTVWRSTIEALRADGGGPVRWRVDLDAVTGDVRHVSTLVQTSDKDFDIMFGNHDSTSSCWVFVDTEDWFDEDGELDDYSPTADHNDDGIEAWEAAHDTWNWYWQNLGLCSYDDDDAEVEIVTHADLEGTIASATGYCGTIQVRDDGSALDIIAHEFTHLVDYNHNDLDYERQSGALDESFADVFGSLIDGNWTIGEATGGAFRDLSDPPRFGDPDHMSGAVSGDDVGFRSVSEPNDDNDNGWVHVNSGIPNKAMYLITVGGTHHGMDVTGIGATRARRLFHDVHRGGLDSDARFVDARDAMVNLATYYAFLGVHGFDADHVCAIANAWASVGVAAAQADEDCDGTADSGDNDDDNDGVTDAYDNCPDVSNVMQSDVDGDGQGDVCDADDDNDGVADGSDNCVTVPNPGQANEDGDARGDACDDGDVDGVLDVIDNCDGVPNWDQTDTDGDGLGDVCDPDMDGDGLANGDDNCPLDDDPNQNDRDRDGVGDVCDNCPGTSNPDQQDCDNNGVGTACDTSPLDPLLCEDFEFVEGAAFVHPLAEVALPHVREELVGRLPDDYRLELTVAGTGDPWVVTDHTGRVIAQSTPILGAVGGLRTATWRPTLDYHYLREDGGRAGFATTYRLATSPMSRDVEVEFALEGVSR